MSNKLINCQIPYFIFQEGDQFVAYSPALALSTCGDTEKDVRRMFAEALKIFINEIIRKGTVEEVLSERGWTKASPEQPWCPPTYKQDFVQVAEGVS